MIARLVCSLVLAMAAAGPLAGVSVAWAEAPRTATYSLPDILTLAVQHNPTLAGAEGVVKQSQGQQIAAGAYPNPSVSGSAGRGAIRDPSTGTRVTERTFTVEQPLE
ncbi:MAG: TolC family protein, partial [Nitrospira sp.]